MKKVSLRILATGLGLVALLLGGACSDSGMMQPLAQDQVTSPGIDAPEIGEKPGDMVSVTVALGSDKGSRSVKEDRVELLVDYYEVFFKKTTDEGVVSVYTGRASRTEGSIRVAVPVDNDYEVLLLAGKIPFLLASSY
ncbi:MAG: hypothetical protein LBD74_01200, partial [Spirochaetaceae bacterium]|nr:hypothetical protein [Spirochaetaceae bacterium]